MNYAFTTLFRITFTITALAFFAISHIIFAQDKAAEIDKMMQLYHKNMQFNGTVLVAEAGKIVFKRGYGMANMEWNIPNEPNTKFRIGSITKQFTSMLIMQLVQDGKIQLDEKITHYLSDYRKDTGSRVTIHHLLTHTSGIPSYTSRPDFFRDISRTPYTVDAFIKKYCSDSLTFEPGSSYSYNNSGYFLLGAIIEKITGKKYEDVLKENILTPLGMKDTGYDRHAAIIANRATGYEKRGSEYINSPYLDMSLPFAAGAMYSTVEDLYLWDQALYTEKLLSHKNKNIMFRPFLRNYAYGWNNRKVAPSGTTDSVQVVRHGGGINGFNSLISRMVDTKSLIVLLNNTGGTVLGRMSQGILNILYGQPHLEPQKSIADVLFKTISNENTSVAIEQYHTLKKNHPDKYIFRERELNRLGYRLLELGKIDASIAIFKLNTEAFPDASNTYDSLGEAYLKKGNTELAITNYKKAMALNPGNKSASKALAKLGIPSPDKEINITAEMLQKYIGKYELAPSFIISITRNGRELHAQATGQNRFQIFPMSITKFYYKVVDAQILFTINDAGAVEGLTLHQNGRDIFGKKVK